jgi:exodeoxyribonuclease VII large subunit
MLASLSYQSVLRRGFALVRDADGRAIRQAHGLAAGVRLDIELADGHIAVETLEPGVSTATPEASAAGRPRPTARAAAPRKPTAANGGSQGSLF